MRQPDPDEESTCNILPLKSEIEYQKRHQKQEEAVPKEKGNDLTTLQAVGDLQAKRLTPTSKLTNQHATERDHLKDDT